MFTQYQSGIGVFLISHTLFAFLNTFYHSGFRVVPVRELVHPEEKDDPDDRHECIPAVSNRQLALASAPDRATDEMQNRYPCMHAASGCRGLAFTFWQGIIGGPVFHVYVVV